MSQTILITLLVLLIGILITSIVRLSRDAELKRKRFRIYIGSRIKVVQNIEPNDFIHESGKWRRRIVRRPLVAAAGVHDVAGAFPGFNEAFAGVGAVELQGEVVHVGRQLHKGGGVGFHFAQQGALVDDLSARRVHHFAEGGDGGGEGGNAGGGHAASGGGGVADGGAGAIKNGRGFVQKHLLAQPHDVGFGHVHLAEIVEVAVFLEMVGEGAGKDERGIFQRGFRRRAGVAAAAGGRIRLRGQDGDAAIIGLELRQVGAEIGGRVACGRRAEARSTRA
jgi:hypothetical protein